MTSFAWTATVISLKGGIDSGQAIISFIGNISCNRYAGIVITISIGENGDVRRSCKRLVQYYRLP
jgi:hypothetical protein